MPSDSFHPSAPLSSNSSPRLGGVVPVFSFDSARGAALWVSLTFMAAAAGGLGSSDAPGFYASLTLPAWAPPASVFGPVWSVLYLLMALSAWMVWRHRHTVRGQTGLGLYALGLLPNALWSWLFFEWHMGLWALVDIALVWVLVGLAVRAFWRVRPLFGALLMPLWAWVSFAAALNASVWQANPALLGG